MKTNQELLRRMRLGVCSVTLLGACMMNFTSCEKYDLDETLPDGWGSSIYSYLDEAGNFNNTKRLIEDLGLKDVLAKTGSKTLFAANDDAFARFYANNTWGVKSYEGLSLSQKKLLLNGSMINNSYQVNDLPKITGAEGAVDGQCMRRFSSQATLDTVARVKVADLPAMNPQDWEYNKSIWKMRSNRKNGEMVLMEDMTTAPMLHFIEAQMTNNKITNDDYNFIYNYTTDRKAGDASVNGVQIMKQNIKCSNGFIHEMADVIMPLPNMAEVIRQNSDLSEYNRLLERFSAPHYAGKSITEQYNLMYKTDVDSVFEKRFFAQKSRKVDNSYKNNVVEVGTQSITFAEDENDLLVFDPEWNSYFTGSTNGSTEEERMKQDMAVMLVPSNTAMEQFWNASSGAGKVLRGQYPGGIHSVPNKVISKLLNNNMLVSFVNSVPSKFANILNSNNDPMDITKADVEKVLLANNGAIYVTNRVFAPTEYVSVLYPSTVNETMSIMDWAIRHKQNMYNVYLNSLQAYYSLFIHTNSTLDYVDPLSVMKGDPQVYRFHYVASRKNDSGESAPVYASIHPYDMDLNIIGDSVDVNENSDALALRLRDILDACIVVNESVEDGNRYYRTMGYQEIEIENGGQEHSMKVYGGHQINEEGHNGIIIDKIYDQTSTTNGKGNGKCYVVDSDRPIMGTYKSVVNILDEHQEFAEFDSLVYQCGILENLHEKKYWSMHDNGNISTFNTYHYTVYVPTNDAILKWKEDNAIADSIWNSTWDDENFKSIDPKSQDPVYLEYLKIKEKRATVLNFVKYHIQDNSLFIGAKPVASKNYGTSLIKNDMFQKVNATLTSSGISVYGIDKNGAATGDPRHVVTSGGLYNLIAREYYFEQEWNSDGAKSKMDCNKLFTTSSAVVHQIDGVLVQK